MKTGKLAEVFSSKKICVLVATYNNAGTLPSVVADLQEYTHDIIVVNDGSTDHTQQLLDTLSVRSIVSYRQNMGKGFALRKGFERAVELGYDYAITIDSDGQHFASDLPAFIDHLEYYPGSIIIGARNMEQSGVPAKSSFGNNFSNFWFWVETGYRMKDTQSGYRLYPVNRLAGFGFITRKYEFEIEVLVRAAWHGIPVTQVPVKVYYAEKEKRVSHFRPFRDFSRISLLNTVLVTIALLYIKPRDLLRDIKKKTSGRFSGSSFSNHQRVTSPRQPQ